VFSSRPRDLTRAVNMPGVRRRVVAYVPEKAATAQCLDTHGDVLAYAKLYAEDNQARSVRNHCALYHRLSTDDPYLRLPRVLGYAAPQRLLFLEPQMGQRVTDLRGVALRTGLRQFGAAVARFHQLPAPPVVSRFTRLDLDHLVQAAGLIGQARPDVAEHAANLVKLLAEHRHSPTAAPVCLHGDVHAKNGIAQHGRVALIDLDQVALGPAAAELGSFLASLHYWRCVGLLTSIEEREHEAAFLEGYATVGSLPDTDAVRWYTAAALLSERALRAVNRIREQGLLHLPKILTTARELLLDSCVGGHSPLEG